MDTINYLWMWSKSKCIRKLIKERRESNIRKNEWRWRAKRRLVNCWPIMRPISRPIWYSCLRTLEGWCWACRWSETRLFPQIPFFSPFISASSSISTIFWAIWRIKRSNTWLYPISMGFYMNWCCSNDIKEAMKNLYKCFREVEVLKEAKVHSLPSVLVWHLVHFITWFEWVSWRISSCDHGSVFFAPFFFNFLVCSERPQEELLI